MTLRRLLLCAALAGCALAPVSSASTPRRCNLAEFASGELIVKGVSCTAAAKVLHRALKHPGCTVSRSDAQLGRGCYGTTRIGVWTCRGLFPGEGYDLRCSSGLRRIHGGAGG